MKRLILITLITAVGVSTVYGAPASEELTKTTPSIEKANRLLHNKQHDEALALLDVILAENPNNVRALRLRGNLHFSNGNFAEALEDLDRIVSLQPRSARAYFDRGIVHMAMENDQHAYDDIERALVLNPKVLENLDENSELAKRLHEEREKAHTAKYQVRHKGGRINTKKGGVVTKVPKN